MFGTIGFKERLCSRYLSILASYSRECEDLELQRKLSIYNNAVAIMENLFDASVQEKVIGAFHHQQRQNKTEDWHHHTVGVVDD